MINDYKFQKQKYQKKREENQIIAQAVCEIIKDLDYKSWKQLSEIIDDYYQRKSNEIRFEADGTLKRRVKCWY